MILTKTNTTALPYGDYDTEFRAMWYFARDNNKTGKLPQDKLAYGHANYSTALFASVWFAFGVFGVLVSPMALVFGEIVKSPELWLIISVMLGGLGLGSLIVGFIEHPVIVRKQREQHAIYVRNYTWLAKKTKRSENDAQSMLCGEAASLDGQTSCFISIEDDNILFYTLKNSRVTRKQIELDEDFTSVELEA